MPYYKNIVDGYIFSLEKRETATNGAEVTETQYNEIISILGNRPAAPDGYTYRLTADMEWELYEIPVVDDSAENWHEITDAEYAAIVAAQEAETQENV